MKLYSVYLSPFAARCRTAIYHKGLENHIAIVPPLARLDTPEWRAINPIGKLPVLDVNGHHVVESEVIVEYIEDRFPEKSLRPTNLEDRALARSLNRIGDLYIFEPFGKLFGQIAANPRDDVIVKAALDGTFEGLRRLEAFLPDSAGPFAVGHSRSTADCSLPGLLFFINYMLPAFGETAPLDRFPKIARYWATATEEPITKKIIGEMQTAFDTYASTGQIV